MADQLRIAHLIKVTPHRAGIYETARDLAAGERKLGHEARMIDPFALREDRGVPIGRDEFVGQCDVIVNHSGLGAYEECKKPVIHIMHGRPHSSFLLEREGKIAVYKFLATAAQNPQYREFVTLWPEYVPYWQLLLQRRPIRVIPPPVDLERWTPDGPSGYSFHGLGGTINVICTDVWREDRDPYHVINAFWHFAKAHPGAKLHLYATHVKQPGVDVLLAAVKSIGALGEVCGFITGLEHVYRAADMLITPHRIATRSVREALACGCNVVAATGNRFTHNATADTEDPIAFAKAIEEAIPNKGQAERNGKADNRRIAEREFDNVKSAAALIEIIREALVPGEVKAVP